MVWGFLMLILPADLPTSCSFCKSYRRLEALTAAGTCCNTHSLPLSPSLSLSLAPSPSLSSLSVPLTLSLSPPLSLSLSLVPCPMTVRFLVNFTWRSLAGGLNRPAPLDDDDDDVSKSGSWLPVPSHARSTRPLGFTTVGARPTRWITSW